MRFFQKEKKQAVARENELYYAYIYIERERERDTGKTWIIRMRIIFKLLILIEQSNIVYSILVFIYYARFLILEANSYTH